eukprot:m.321394 g.321394  ORF g.321394 m.321394 type:complete len:314 (+) comp20335_c1_seq1:282-1223(+)
MKSFTRLLWFLSVLWTYTAATTDQAIAVSSRDCIVDPPNCTNMSQFIVISRQRAGTHFLAQTLMSNERIFHGPEILYRHDIRTLDQFCTSMNTYLDFVCREASRVESVTSIGGIMMHSDFMTSSGELHRSFSPRDVFEILSRSKVKVIVYERRNTLAQAVSVLFHRQNKIFGSASEARVHRMRSKKLNTTAEAIYHEAHSISQGYARARWEISRAQMEMPLQVMTVFYEDLQHLDGLKSLQVHSFLDAIPAISTTVSNETSVPSPQPGNRAQLLKVHTGSVFQYLNSTLAEEVRCRFSDTPLAWMVADCEQLR